MRTKCLQYYHEANQLEEETFALFYVQTDGITSDRGVRRNIYFSERCPDVSREGRDVQSASIPEEGIGVLSSL